MNAIEKNEILSLPEKYRPLSAWAYFWLSVLYSLPLIGFIMLIVHAVSSENINRRSFARSFFCLLVIVAILAGASIALGLGATLAGMLS